MKDEHERLHTQLERATSRNAVPESELDGETAQLRDAWNALGRLLEATSAMQEPSFDQWIPPPSSSPRRRRFMPVAVALAASLLVCAGAVWMWQADRAGQPNVASPQTVVASVSNTTQGVASFSEAGAASELKWDDSFDEQLVQAQQQMIRVRQDWGSQLVAMAVVGYQWEQVRQDVEGNAL